MVRRAFTSAAVVVVLCGIVACGSSSGKVASWPSRSTPMSSTRGWFQAINAHNRVRLLAYVAPTSQDQMGWASTAHPWARFTDIRCGSAHGSTQSQPVLMCTFHEQGTLAEEGSPVSFWTVSLEHTSRGWLINNYGQG